MKYLDQSAFTEPKKRADLRDEPLVIHRRLGNRPGRYLAIFVHGLGGRRYGKNTTWGDFPKLIFKRYPNVDVGMYSYRTLFRRFLFWKSINLDQEAETLADLLSGLSEYFGFILLGHSMGGLLCKGVVAHLVNNDREDVVSRIDGLVLMATPQLGSLNVPNLLAWITKDFQALKAHNNYISDVQSAFENRIHTALRYPRDEKAHVPCWALIAAEDFWVDKLSAGIGLSDDQKLTIRASHTSVVKPTGEDAASFCFVTKCFEHALHGRLVPLRRHKCIQGLRADLPSIRQIAVTQIGGAVSPLDLMKQWWDVNPRTFWTIRRIVSTPTSEDVELVGYFCVIPLKASAVQGIRTGAVTGATLKPEFIAKVGERSETLYLGAVAAIDTRSRAAVMDQLLEHLRTFKSMDRAIVLTRPTTYHGLRVIRSTSFRPVNGVEGLNELYEAELSALISGVK